MDQESPTEKSSSQAKPFWKEALNSTKNWLINPTVLKTIAVVLLSVLYITLVTYKIPLPAAEDLPRQMMNGKEILQGDFRSITQNLYSYTDPSHYFANHHWLYGVFAYLLHQAVGWSGMVIFKVLIILLTFIILFKAALQKANFWLVAACSLPAILLMAGRSDLRPELFGYFFIAVYIYALLRWEKRPDNRIFWLIPLQILWANLHITWPIGPMIAAGFLLEKIILSAPVALKQKFSRAGVMAMWSNPLTKRLLLLLILLVAVSFINPLGIHGVLYSLDKNIGAHANGPLVSSEVQPISSMINSEPVNSYRLTYVLIGLLVASFIIGFKQKNIFYLLGGIAAAIMTVNVQRGASFLGMFFLLAVPSNLTPVFWFFKKWIAKVVTRFKVDLELVIGWGLISGLILYLCFNSVGFVQASNFGVGLSKNAEDAAKFFISNHLSGPIFNDTDIGSYLIWYLYPNEKVFTDNRFADAYSDDFFNQDYIPAFTDEAKWQKILNKYNFNTIILYQYDGGGGVRDFIARRIGDPEWAWVYGDRYGVILVRNLPRNQAVIAKYSINALNMKDRFASLTSSLDGADQVAVGDLFALGGAPNWARGSYAIALSQHPKWAKIWWAMGQMELLRGSKYGGDPALGALDIENAIRYGWVTPEAYSYLALAYYQMGFLDKAEEAVHKELKINPKSEDGKRWLDVLAKDRLEAQEKAAAARAVEEANQKLQQTQPAP